MAKLNKAELARQIITEDHYISDGGVYIKDLYQQYGPSAYLVVDYDYSDCSIRIITQRSENDEEYNIRLDQIRKSKELAAQRAKAKAKKIEDSERALYEELKKKFET